MFVFIFYDVWDKYFDCYGLEGIFFVVKIVIGNFVVVVFDEILFLEVVWCVVMCGVEILFYFIFEIYGLVWLFKEVVKVFCVVENMMYVIFINIAGIVNFFIFEVFVDGGFKIFDYWGLILVKIGVGESMVVYVEIDIIVLCNYCC